MRNILHLMVLISGILFASYSLAAALSDPTRPMNTESSSESGLLVKTIIISSSRQLALVNSTWVTVGDEVRGATVMAIKRSEVVFKVDGEELVVPVVADVFARSKHAEKSPAKTLIKVTQ